MYLKPADRLIEGIPLKVRDPDLGDHLPPEGRDVPESLYWHRRLMDGDVVRCEPVTTIGVDVQSDAVVTTEPTLMFVSAADVLADEVDRSDA